MSIYPNRKDLKDKAHKQALEQSQPIGKAALLDEIQEKIDDTQSYGNRMDFDDTWFKNQYLDILIQAMQLIHQHCRDITAEQLEKLTLKHHTEGKYLVISEIIKKHIDFKAMAQELNK